MSFRNTVEFEVSGAYALFSDPIMRVGGEKTSLHAPTYEALKGILSSVYWKPVMTWVIDAVRIMNPIQTEVKGIRPINLSGGNDLSFYTYLKDCRYQVRAHFVWNENRPELAEDRNEHKHHNVARRMIERGGRRDVFLGTRECQGYVSPCVFGEGIGHYDETPELALGLSYHGITYADEAYSEETKGKMTVRFWNPVMRKGMIEFLPPEKCEITRAVREMGIKRFGEQQGNYTGLLEFSEGGELFGDLSDGVPNV
jgi:CRISPR-associated protein Cas5d